MWKDKIQLFISMVSCKQFKIYFCLLVLYITYTKFTRQSDFEEIWCANSACLNARKGKIRQNWLYAGRLHLRNNEMYNERLSAQVFVDLPISTKLLLGGLLLQPFSQWLHSEVEQTHMVSGRWFMMTGLYREQYCITDEWFFMAVLYVKKYTAVPQLGLDRTKTGCSIRSELSRGIAATNDCSDDLSFQYFWKILQSLIDHFLNIF